MIASLLYLTLKNSVDYLIIILSCTLKPPNNANIPLKFFPKKKGRPGRIICRGIKIINQLEIINVLRILQIYTWANLVEFKVKKILQLHCPRILVKIGHVGKIIHVIWIVQVVLLIYLRVIIEKQRFVFFMIGVELPLTPILHKHIIHQLRLLIVELKANEIAWIVTIFYFSLVAFQWAICVVSFIQFGSWGKKSHVTWWEVLVLTIRMLGIISNLLCLQLQSRVALDFDPIIISIHFLLLSFIIIKYFYDL